MYVTCVQAFPCHVLMSCAFSGSQEHFRLIVWLWGEEKDVENRAAGNRWSWKIPVVCIAAVACDEVFLSMIKAHRRLC